MNEIEQAYQWQLRLRETARAYQWVLDYPERIEALATQINHEFCDSTTEE